MILVARQLQTYAGDLHRNRVVARQFSGTFQMLISARFVTTLLRGFGGQQIVYHRLFSVIGILRHQLLNLLVIAFRQLKQRLFGLLTCAAAFTPDKPAASVRAGAENASQQPTQWRTE
ncbi:Uncharacterised protein [Citrobacter koseri]|uniref:Uncharacterized protein n=1 Tax=Citrobacter koseri TaxID=545 RepID=A0A2X2YSX6_CITKO|nr:Uncharacterised protein [Citrobacter koseri]